MRIGSRSSCFSIAVVAFVAALIAAVAAPHDAAAALRVAVISDFNGPYGSVHYNPEVHGAIRKIIELRPDLVLATGDMIAGQKASLTDQRVRQMWDSFHRAVTSPLERVGIPFAVTPGNHDASGYPGHARDRRIYVDEWKTRFAPLDFVDREHYPLRYAFRAPTGRKGSALFVSLDATNDSAMDVEQKKWLLDLLDRHRDATVKILFAHFPVLPFAHDRETAYLKDPTFEADLKRHGVTLYLSGHHHAYFPGKRGSLRLVGTSCIGDGARRLLGTLTPSKKSFIWIEVDDSGIASLEALAAPDFDRVIERSTLPRSVGFGALAIPRDDL